MGLVGQGGAPTRVAPVGERRTAGVLVAVVLVAVSLLAVNSRVSVSAISSAAAFFPPSFGLSTVWLGWFGFAAPAAFAVVSPLAHWLIGRRGPIRAAAAFATGIAMTSMVRMIAPDVGWLFLSDVAVLLCMGAANVVLPVLVKAEFQRATGVVSALYISLVAGGAALPAFLGADLSALFGWRGSFVVWGALAALGAVAWLPALRGLKGRSPHSATTAGARTPGVLVRSRNAQQSSPAAAGQRRWNVVGSRPGIAICILSAVASVNFYVMFGWLPTLLREAFGLDAAQSGALLGLYSVCQIPASVILPLLISRRWLGPVGALSGALLSVIGYIVLATGEAAAILPGVLAIGFGQLCFPLFLTLVVQRADDSSVAASLSAWAQMIGFGLAAVAPVGVAVLIGSGIGWAPVLSGLAGVSAAGVVAGLIVGDRTVRGRASFPRRDNGDRRR